MVGFTGSRMVLGCALAALSLAASPAVAQESAASAQIAGSVKAAPADGDAEFRQLFASWKAYEATGGVPAPRSAVSVPSRMPVEGFALTSDFGMRTHPVLGGRRNHKGVDLASPSGTPVYATADGVVGMADHFGSYGNYVQIEHGGELQTRYAHLSSYTVALGDTVRKGDLIGYVGSTGRSTGPHLHYEVRVAGEAVDPRPYMVATELAVNEAAGGRGGPE